jgi:hypothetical protein
MEYQPVEDGKWSKASLRISSTTLQPSEIAEIIGLEATKTHTKGTLKNSRFTLVWPTSLWLLNSPLSDQNGMADHLRFLLDLLEPKMDALKQLFEKCQIDLFCGFSSDSGQGGFTLDAVTLSRLSKLCVPLVLDLYPPGPIEATENGPDQ